MYYRSLLLIFVIGYIASSCSNGKNVGQTQDTVQITIHVDLLKKHCGGMPPPRDYTNGTKKVPFQNATFYIKKGSENSEESPAVTSFTTDEKGNATVQLEKGTYCIIIRKKNEPFEKFYDNNRRSEQFTQSKPEKCFREWYASCDGTLTVAEKDTSTTLLVKENCNYGVNPCLEYTGPPQP